MRLELLTGFPGALGRRVAGAHPIEIPQPSTWLERDWVMLTTGVRLRNNTGAQRGLIRELDSSGAAALGFGIEVVFKRTPRALLSEARQRGFPVFSIPLCTPFRDIVSTVNRALLSSDLRTLQRVSSMQLHFMDALGEDDPRQAVIERLGAFVGATVLLFAPDGRLAAATGKAPHRAIWREVQARPAALLEFDSQNWHTVTTPVSGVVEPASWLSVTSPRALPSPHLARQGARATAPVLTALSRIDDVARRQGQAIGAALLEEMLRAHGRNRESILARVSSFGLDFAVPARVVLVCPHDDVDRARPLTDLAAAFERLTKGLTKRGIAHLAARRAGSILMLVQATPAELAEELERLVEELPGLVAGIGRPVSDVGAVPNSHRDAQIAFERVRSSHRPAINDFNDFDLATLILSEAPRERTQVKVDELLAALRPNAGLREAIVSYFDHGLDVMRTAEAMHVHHNTLRYRLGRVEEALGRSLKDPATIASLYLALAVGDDGDPPGSGT